MTTSLLTFSLPNLIAYADPTHRPTHDLNAGSSVTLPGATHFLGLVPVNRMPSGIPYTPNLRKPNLNTGVAKQIKKSLQSNDGNFHLMNKGITLLATSVRALSTSEYEVIIDCDEKTDGDGILDGGHTYATLFDTSTKEYDLHNQYVFIWIRVNIPNELKAGIAEALNNTATVSVASLANRRDEFNWIKEQLGLDCSKKIAWQQNETGKQAKVEELIAQLYAVNLYFSVNAKDSYASRAKTLSAFRQKPEEFKSHETSVMDTLRFFELIQYGLADRIETLLGQRAIEKKATHYMPIYDTGISPRKTRVSRSVALVLLSGIGVLIKEESNNKFVLDRSVEDAFALYTENWEAISKALKDCWDTVDVAGDPGAFGKRDETWKTLYQIISSLVTASTKPIRATTSLIVYDPFDELGLEPGELEEFWNEDLLEAKFELNELQERISKEGNELTAGQILDLIALSEYIKQRVQMYDDAIASIRTEDFGFCRSCKNQISIERLFEAQYALRCGEC